jgi:hypothetical protein
VTQNTLLDAIVARLVGIEVSHAAQQDNPPVREVFASRTIPSPPAERRRAFHANPPFDDGFAWWTARARSIAPASRRKP